MNLSEVLARCCHENSSPSNISNIFFFKGGLDIMYGLFDWRWQLFIIKFDVFEENLMLTFCLMVFFQYAQCQWIDPKCNHKVIIARETMGFQFLCWHGAGKKLNLIKKLRSDFYPYLPKTVFPQTLAMPSTSLDQPLSEIFLQLHNIFTFSNMALDKVPWTDFDLPGMSNKPRLIVASCSNACHREKWGMWANWPHTKF